MRCQFCHYTKYYYICKLLFITNTYENENTSGRKKYFNYTSTHTDCYKLACIHVFATYMDSIYDYISLDHILSSYS